MTYVEMYAECVAETEDHLVCEFTDQVLDGGKQFHVPKYDVSHRSEVQGEGDCGTLRVAEGWAADNGLEGV